MPSVPTNETSTHKPDSRVLGNDCNSLVGTEGMVDSDADILRKAIDVLYRDSVLGNGAAIDYLMRVIVLLEAKSSD